MSYLEALQPHKGGISSGSPTSIFASGTEPIQTDNFGSAVIPTLETLQPHKGGISSGSATRIFASGAEPRRTDNFRSAVISAAVIPASEPIRTDNFRPATITASTNGSIQGPPSFLPVFFGAGLAMLIILNSGRGSLFTLNFR